MINLIKQISKKKLISIYSIFLILIIIAIYINVKRVYFIDNEFFQKI